MHRNPSSHKGENGKVAVVGGSFTMHGAPLFSALAAEAGGADLLYVAVPRCHAEAAKAQSLNFQVHPFRGDELAHEDIAPLLRMLATVDAAVIGPGLLRTQSAQRVLCELVEGAPCPLVLDASALQPWTMGSARGKDVVLTPHLGELERMGLAPADLQDLTADTHLTIHLKGPIDRIFSRDGMREVAGGNAGLTVGGTGDALAGLIASLRAQDVAAAEACALASSAIKAAGDRLHAEFGYAYGTRAVIGGIATELRRHSR